MSSLPSKIPRELLAEVFNNNSRMIKTVEDIITQLNTYIPQNVIAINDDISSTNTDLQALSTSLDTLSNDLDTLNSSLTALSDSLGTMATQNSDNITVTGGSVTIDTLSINNADFISTVVSLNDYAGSSVGTLTNAPTAGNPTKWILIDDNGTLRRLPSW